MPVSKELVAASATPLILSILNRDESYGYAIIQQVHELSDGQMQWKDGMLYPVLHRLQNAGLVTSRWGSSDAGRKRKYYQITEEGRSELARHRDQWVAVDHTLKKLWEEDPCLT